MRPFSSLSLSSGHISICVASVVRRSPPPESQSSFLQNQRKERPKRAAMERASVRSRASPVCQRVRYRICLGPVRFLVALSPRSSFSRQGSFEAESFKKLDWSCLHRRRRYAFLPILDRPSVASSPCGPAARACIHRYRVSRNLGTSFLGGLLEAVVTSEVVRGRSDEGPCACLIDVF